MMRDTDRIAHMLQAIADSRESIRGLTKRAFLKNKDKQYAAERCVMIVGEAAAMVTEATKKKYPDLPWDAMRGMRNILAHEYMNVDYGEVWNVVKADFRKLEKKLKILYTEIEN